MILSAPLFENMSIRRFIIGVPLIGINGLGICIPSFDNREPFPAAIIPNFILIILNRIIHIRTYVLQLS